MPAQFMPAARCAARLTTLSATLLACSAQAQRAEVLHWWTSAGESAAVNELASAYRQAGGIWVDSAVAGGDSARAAAISRIAGSSPPTAAQFNLSQQYLDVIAEGLLNDVDSVAAQQQWATRMPQPVIDSIRFGGHWYAVPLNLHNPIWFWSSKAALRQAGVKGEPRSFDELFAALDKLKAAGLVPLAVGGQTWQEFITFYAVLLHEAGPPTYLAYFRDHDARSVDSAPFRKALATFKRLRAYVDAGSPGRNWNDATAMLISGKAGFQIMGDWAKGEFERARLVAGKDYGCAIGFGPDAPYTIAGDVFVLPKSSDKAVLEAQRKLAATVTAPAVQLAFNRKKGSIPVRSDLDGSSLDACAQAGLRAIKDARRVVANPDMLMSPDQVGAVQDVVAAFWHGEQSVADAAKALQQALKR